MNVNRLKQVISGYGNKSIITAIEDIKEDRFYCLKETEYSIRVPIEINKQVIKTIYSFGLNSAIYNIDDFNKIIDQENYIYKNDEEVI